MIQRNESIQTIKRKDTAMSRSRLSRPMQLCLDADIISKEYGLLDYGCGRGGDVRRLSSLGYSANGWDPVYQPDSLLQSTDIVNLGYVINVIENYDERCETLRAAWQLTKKVLIVSARMVYETDTSACKEYNDGFVTQRNTFQKFYTQNELRDWIHSTLQEEPVAIAPGIYLMFRDESMRQAFIASRFRSRAFAPRPRISDILYEQHKDLLGSLIDFYLLRGRLPENDELTTNEEISTIFGSVRQAFSVIRRVTGLDQWEKIRTNRSTELLIYLGLSRLNGRLRMSKLPRELQLDIRSFFGAHKRACVAADELLFSAGDMSAISKAMETAGIGKLLPSALYVHESALSLLPPILRVYEGCARNYLGSVTDTNIIKLNRLKPKVSYLSYPKFDRDPHPTLHFSLGVQLNTFDVRFYDNRDSDNPPILHRKETFVGPDYPAREKFVRLTRQEERHGLYANTSTIGRKTQWEQLLIELGVQHKGHRVVPCKAS